MYNTNTKPSRPDDNRVAIATDALGQALGNGPAGLGGRREVEFDILRSRLPPLLADVETLCGLKIVRITLVFYKGKLILNTL